MSAGDFWHGERQRRPHRRRGKRTALRLTLSLLVLTGAAGVALNVAGLQPPPALLARADGWIVAQGFGIDQISLEGHRFTPDNDIFDALDLGSAGSMLRFNGTEAAARILRLPWIQRVQIKPLVPNGLQIVITERTPYAVWEQDDPIDGVSAMPAARVRRVLIDQTGHVLAAAGPETFPELPRVRGAGAGSAAADLHATLALFPTIGLRLQVAERIGGRRWTLALDHGLRIHLPAEQEAAAMQSLAVLQASHGLLDRDLAVIDVRPPGITVRARVDRSPPQL